MNYLKAAILVPFAFVQIITWMYATMWVAQVWVFSFMSWEQDLDEHWVLYHIAYFIWTNQLVRIFRTKEAPASE